jgi:hypothetical protein
VNNWGLFVQPWYFSETANQWYKLTYSGYPLDTAIGTGYGSSHWSGTNIVDLYNLVPTRSSIDYSDYIVTYADTSKNVGYGKIVATSGFVIGGKKIFLENTFSLGQQDKFVKIVTRVINNHTSDLENLIIWTGTRDDYVGTTDVNTKSRGNLDTGSFVEVTSNTQSSRAIMITNTNEGVLFYSESAGVMTAYSLCCQFSNAYNTNPLSLPPRTLSPTDGSYAAVLPIGNITSNSSGSITWYYAAGTIGSLTSVAQSVAVDQVASGPVVSSVSSHATLAPLSTSSHETLSPLSSTSSYATPLSFISEYASPLLSRSSYATLSPLFSASSYASPLSSKTSYATLSSLSSKSSYATPLSSKTSHASPLSSISEYATPLSSASEYATPLSSASEYATPLSSISEYATPLSSASEYATLSHSFLYTQTPMFSVTQEPLTMSATSTPSNTPSTTPSFNIRYVFIQAPIPNISISESYITNINEKEANYGLVFIAIFAPLNIILLCVCCVGVCFGMRFLKQKKESIPVRKIDNDLFIKSTQSAQHDIESNKPVLSKRVPRSIKSTKPVLSTRVPRNIEAGTLVTRVPDDILIEESTELNKPSST